MKTIFCDGIFDLFHIGHLKHLEKINQYFTEPIYLIVGVINDTVSTYYKRKPILTENIRYEILKSCVYTNKIILLDSLIITKELIEKYKIDYVFHAFSDQQDVEKQNEFYKIPIQENKFISIEYNKGISTTKIIKDSCLNWKEIWEKKGNVDTQDIMLLNGWEKTDFQPDRFVRHVISTFGIKSHNNVLEMGCGAGVLAKEFTRIISPKNYVGVDASLSLVNKHLKFFNHIVLNFNSNDTIFKTKYFDFSVCNGMVEYLRNTEELNQTIKELERVSRKGVYFGSVRCVSRTKKCVKHVYDGVYKHFIVPKQYFIDRGYTICLSNYDSTERYDAFKIFD